MNTQTIGINPTTGGINSDGTKAPRADRVKEMRSEFEKALGNVALDDSSAKTQSGKQEVVSNLKFSNHAIERIQSRGIKWSAEDLGKIEAAVNKAEQKGSQNSLILTGNSALIVNVKNKTVVTVMDQNALKENVFTNIDSTVVI